MLNLQLVLTYDRCKLQSPQKQSLQNGVRHVIRPLYDRHDLTTGMVRLPLNDNTLPRQDLPAAPSSPKRPRPNFKRVFCLFPILLPPPPPITP